MPVKTHDVLREELRDAVKKVEVGAVYAHFKNQDQYRVINLAFYESDESLCVIYQSVTDPDLRFIQPLTRWLEKKEKDGVMVDRFTKLENL